LISFRWTLSCLLKDHAVAPSRHDATLFAEGVVNHVRGLNSTVTDLEALAVEHGAKVVTFDADLEPFGAYVVVPT